jgi:hypothetical protein
MDMGTIFRHLLGCPVHVQEQTQEDERIYARLADNRISWFDWLAYRAYKQFSTEGLARGLALIACSGSSLHSFFPCGSISF